MRFLPQAGPVFLIVTGIRSLKEEFECFDTLAISELSTKFLLGEAELKWLDTVTISEPSLAKFIL